MAMTASPYYIGSGIIGLPQKCETVVSLTSTPRNRCGVYSKLSQLCTAKPRDR